MNTPIIGLSFDDACANHRTTVAPLLQELGFGATFFVCEFPEFDTDREQYMSWSMIAELDRMGFEIGNHTMTHAGVGDLDEAGFLAELSALEAKARRYGIDVATSFAYPGGGTADYVPKLLKAKNYRFARTCETTPYRPGKSDPMYLPAYPVHGDDFAGFEKIIDQAAEGVIPILLYHGVPEYLHPWVNTDPAVFVSEMKLLQSRGCRVLALRDLP